MLKSMLSRHSFVDWNCRWTRWALRTIVAWTYLWKDLRKPASGPQYGETASFSSVSRTSGSASLPECCERLFWDLDILQCSSCCCAKYVPRETVFKVSRMEGSLVVLEKRSDVNDVAHKQAIALLKMHGQAMSSMQDVARSTSLTFVMCTMLA